MTEQSEMEALLRAAFPEAGDELPAFIDVVLSGHYHDLRVTGLFWRRILSHLRAEVAKAYELGHSVGQHDATTGEDVRAAEAAVLERAADKFCVAAEQLWSNGSKELAIMRRQDASDVRALISPTSRTAYAEAIAAAEERGRPARDAEVLAMRRIIQGLVWTSNYIRCPIKELQDARDFLEPPPQPPQGAKETQS